MTRASLLHILDHVNGISDAEVRELEQLAAAFPYCQTAHVLLAKASHDRGSMLASQRLRRAATYAADRELLRQLLEQPAAPQHTGSPIEPEASNIVSPEPTPAPPMSLPAEAAPADEVFGADAPFVPQGPVASAPPEPEAVPDHPEAPDHAPTAEAVAHEVAAEPVTEEGAVPEPTDSNLFEIAQPGTTLAPPADAPAATEEEPQPAAAEPAPNAPVATTTALATTAVAPAGSDDDILPAVAPPIRPPADGGISRFEFGLSQPTLAEPVAYQLPELEEDDDELPTLDRVAQAAPAPVAPFRADADLGYALGAGSRLGYDLQPHDGYTLDLPLDAFFEPDALLLAHLKAHRPSPTASSLDLINRFLKTQPRIKTPGGIPLPAEQQPDLSVRSTSAAPALASESLAKIMVRQGKKDKAIEIYERLMERQPEKKAYFADQIQQLQQPSE